MPRLRLLSTLVTAKGLSAKTSPISRPDSYQSSAQFTNRRNKNIFARSSPIFNIKNGTHPPMCPDQYRLCKTTSEWLTTTDSSDCQSVFTKCFAARVATISPSDFVNGPNERLLFSLFLTLFLSFYFPKSSTRYGFNFVTLKTLN